MKLWMQLHLIDDIITQDESSNDLFVIAHSTLNPNKLTLLFLGDDGKADIQIR